MRRDVAVAGLLGAAVATVAVAVVDAARPDEYVVTAKAFSGEDQIGVTAEGWTYSIPTSVAWRDAEGSFHESGRPECLPPTGADEVDGALHRRPRRRRRRQVPAGRARTASPVRLEDRAGRGRHCPRPRRRGDQLEQGRLGASAVRAACRHRRRLADMARGEHPWEADVRAEQALARLVTVHLDESLATRARRETGWWSYDGGFFRPPPPWELSK